MMLILNGRGGKTGQTPTASQTFRHPRNDGGLEFHALEHW
jgi:hypothetical protein